MNWRGRRQLIISMLKKRQFAELKKLVLRRLYINFIWRPVGFPLAIIVIPLLYFIEPFKRIRVGVIPTARIGHLTIEPELFLRRKKASGIFPIMSDAMSECMPFSEAAMSPASP